MAPKLVSRRPRRARPCLDLLEERTLLSFGSPSVFNTGATNNAVAIGNIFGDTFPSGGAIPDLVTASTSGSIIIAQGKGNGTFQTPIRLSTPAASFSSVTLANLRGNSGGPEDIIAADPTENEVWVFLNQGNGTFGAPSAYSTAAGPRDVVVANLGNGTFDLVTADAEYNTTTKTWSSYISVLLGNGDGTFQAHQDYSVGTDPVALAVGDLNNDGSPDIVTASNVGNSVSILRGNGDGTFQPAFDIPITVIVNNLISRASAPVDVALGDFNGDGNLDIVTANSGTASVTVMDGNGDGTFGIEQNIVVDTLLPPDPPSAVVAADLY